MSDPKAECEAAFQEFLKEVEIKDSDFCALIWASFSSGFRFGAKYGAKLLAEKLGVET